VQAAELGAALGLSRALLAKVALALHTRALLLRWHFLQQTEYFFYSVAVYFRPMHIY
jgi:hypothetical protein